MKKADKILLAVITLSAAVFFLAGVLRGAFRQTAVNITVYADNEKTAQYSLGIDGVYEIKTAYGYNILTVKNKEAYISESDCPNGDCMKMKVNEHGGSIICLPLHLVIKSSGAHAEDVDAVAR